MYFQGRWSIRRGYIVPIQACAPAESGGGSAPRLPLPTAPGHSTLWNTRPQRLLWSLQGFHIPGTWTLVLMHDDGDCAKPSISVKCFSKTPWCSGLKNTSQEVFFATIAPNASKSFCSKKNIVLWTDIECLCWCSFRTTYMSFFITMATVQIILFAQLETTGNV